MPGNKSPGQDGITIEFYKLYWDLIGNDLYEVLQHGLIQGELSYSQYLALITLLYKKGPREDIANWRPISLLNVDYKILSKVLAERLKVILPKIIHSNQKGCISGRYIGENVRLIEDLLFEIENLDEDAIIFLQDQLKAFDRVEWLWLFSTLKFYNFGDKFLGWLKTLYKNAKCSILTNGYQSEYFKITRGIRQGDSLSALLYIIQMEPLAEKIRNINTVEGIPVKLRFINNEVIEPKCCQYVDDSTSFLKNKTFIRELMATLKEYEKVSGSRINRDKTVALIKQHPIFEEKIECIKLVNGPEKVLGVPIGGNDPTNDALWTSLITKLKAKLNIWRQRGLSLEGRTYIIKSVGISQLLYTLNLKTIEQSHKKEIENILWDFLWKGKNLRFNKRICSLPRKMGGLDLVDINILEKVRRINWVIRVLKANEEQDWSRLIENYLRCLDNQFSIQFFALKVTDSTDLIKAANIPQFYRECILFFQELSSIARVNFKEEIIWCNHRLKFRGKPIYFKHWAKDGILRPSHIYKNGELDEPGMRNRLTHVANFFFEFQTIKAVFPRSTNNAIVANENGIEEDGKEDILNYVFKISENESKRLRDLSSKDIYNIFLFHDVPPMMAKTYWAVTSFPNYQFDWNVWGDLIFTNPILPRNVRGHHFQIFHGLLYLESKLRHFKHKDGSRYSDGLCTWCLEDRENYFHMLTCKYRQKIWIMIENTIQRAFGILLPLNELIIRTGYFDYNHSHALMQIINMILAMTRHLLWNNRCTMKKQKVTISFQECYHMLKHYLTNHIALLQMSDTTKADIKEALPEVINSIEFNFRNGLTEDDF